jgi:hypothetical protein
MTTDKTAIQIQGDATWTITAYDIESGGKLLITFDRDSARLLPHIGEITSEAMQAFEEVDTGE